MIRFRVVAVGALVASRFHTAHIAIGVQEVATPIAVAVNIAHIVVAGVVPRVVER